MAAKTVLYRLTKVSTIHWSHSAAQGLSLCCGTMVVVTQWQVLVLRGCYWEQVAYMAQESIAPVEECRLEGSIQLDALRR